MVARSKLFLFAIVCVIVPAASCSEVRPLGEPEPSPDVSAPPSSPIAGESEPSADRSPETTTDASLALGACDGPPGRTLRTLIIGNSNIYYWDLPRLVSVLSRSGPPACARIEADGFTRGGQNLERLWTGGDSLGRDLATTIKGGRYDVVVVSESIDLLELEPPFTRFVEYATRIIDAARASGAEPILYASPYVDQRGHYGFVEMAAPQIALGKALRVKVAAAGLAWLRVWEELPDVFLHHTDHSHPGFKGSMVSAKVLYAVVTGGTPIGLTTAPDVDCDGEPCPPISAVERDVFQRAAWEEAQATGLE